MNKLKYRFVNEQDCCKYQDECIDYNAESSERELLRTIKIGEIEYATILERGRPPKSIEEAINIIKGIWLFSKPCDVCSTVNYPLFRYNRTTFDCGYCGSSAIGELEIALRKILLYIRPPTGTKDLRIKSPYFADFYVYRVISRYAHCSNCGATVKDRNARYSYPYM